MDGATGSEVVVGAMMVMTVDAQSILGLVHKGAFIHVMIANHR